MFREVKVDKENIVAMILLDFKDIVGSVAVKSSTTPADMLLPRRTAVQGSKKVDDFVKKMDELYDCSGTFVRDTLLNHLSEITWIDDEEE